MVLLRDLERLTAMAVEASQKAKETPVSDDFVLTTPNYIDLMHISVIRHFSDGRPSEMQRSWTNLVNNEKKKRDVKRKVVVEQEAEIVL